MNNKIILFFSFLVLASTVGCSRKTHPETISTNTAKTPAVKPAKRVTVKTAVPKVIVVNDKVAQKSLDGRYYYDLEGHRYWRNNRDGRYYLFNKSMFDNPDFKAPGGR
jgi:hypothetical protein